MSRVFARHLANTIHGHVFGTIIVDEAHIARNPKMMFTAINNLRQMSGGTVIAMTATLLLMRPGDLWNLGHLMGMEGFGEEKLEDLKAMERDLSSVLRRDRRRLKQSEQSNEVLDRITHGRSVHAKLVYLSVVAEKMETLCNRFAGLIVRQMVNLLDFKVDPISGLPMYHEHIIQWPVTRKWHRLFPLILDNRIRLPPSNGKLDLGQCGHPTMSDAHVHRWVGRLRHHDSYTPMLGCYPSTSGALPGRTMDVASSPQSSAPVGWPDSPPSKTVKRVRVVDHLYHAKYHAEVEGFPGDTPPRSRILVLRISLRTLPVYIHVETKDHISRPYPKGRVCALCHVPVTEFLQEHNIEYLRVIGQGMSVKQRSVNLERFHKSGVNSPCVLLLSGIGMVGLNIADVNILIIMDTLWPVQEDGQLIGRLWQHLQLKRVHIYWLITAGTLDVCLNNISFKKGYNTR
ncbi:hypothetical protein WOLCODRAFT_85327 [Wolfiporia cocos MD-104 SS10]|uniref:Helicase C-terminal domain-containing protein n=1 Tax=Wolfiporia cocos (strain MD-104) TaxID=742152 RepID=A0A2H3JCB5_WOLCO|nr:hypothetical protein WOLCODRAFT_85327 [Wolfiporia cocos MD-104 SS10]